MKKLHFENLDGLRFFSFLSVFLFHSFYTENIAIKTSHTYHFIKYSLWGNGNLGVNFFFVLSGFLISYLLIEEKKTLGKVNIPHFYLRRVLRIWPLYFAAVLFGFFVFPLIKTLFGQSSSETAHLINYLTFTSNFDLIKNGLPDASILGVLWSIAIEEQFYLIWPLIIAFVPTNKLQYAFITIISASWAARAFFDNYMFHEYHTLSCISDMAIGSFGAWLIITQDGLKSKISSTKKVYIILLYSVIAVFYFFRTELLMNSFVIRIFERSILAVLFLFVILEQNYATRSFYKMSAFKTISKLGNITYGLYCLHFIGILIAIKTVSFLMKTETLLSVLVAETFVSLFVSVVIARLSYKYLESPFLKMKNRFAFIVRA
ncbi:MAG: acyltransferase [Bacteroidetes bacterium HGW-Bacteroidetes-6]|jgi:peptidoglycan/LPS O-acetylase OafA/YrhL|nr:MAG: acyltransferase [Bacteroidetes bacterium HGW-Bacteroidetes-6]